MPEGHSIHRLAAAFESGFAGAPVRLASPQGRFEAEAAALDGQVLLGAEAVGKHLLLAFGPAADVDPADPAVRWIHVHLGLYGSWTFAGEPGFAAAHAIGAPRRAVAPGEDDADEDAWRRLVPRATVRLRVAGPRGLADLTGPTACEVIDAPQREALLARIGPDPLRPDSDPERFVTRVLGSRSGIGVLLMNQDVLSGVGNIYRAEVLFRARLDPFMPGTSLSAPLLRGIWEDLAALMTYGVRTGRIVTTEPEHRAIEAEVIERSRGQREADAVAAGAVPRAESFYVYHRQGLPCRICGAPVRSQEVAGRTLFWCATCQRPRVRRAAWSRDHPASAWALEQS